MNKDLWDAWKATPAVMPSELLPNAGGVLGGLYTADQMQACRAAALEEATKTCRLLATCEENSDNYRDGAAWCAEQIRSLK